MKNKKRFIKGFVLHAAVLLAIGFTWYNSLKSPVDSSLDSGSVQQLFRSINQLLHFELLPTEELVLRKLAHFSEYFVLMLLLLTTLFCCYRARLQGVVNALFIGFATAAVDETLQLVSLRGSSLVDVWIDTTGLLAATAVFMLGFCIVRTVRGKLK